MLGDTPKRFPKIRLSKKTLLEVGHQLEQAVAFHHLHDAPAPAKGCEDAVKLLKQALRLPKDFSFTSARAFAWEREKAQWPAQTRKRFAQKGTP